MVYGSLSFGGDKFLLEDCGGSEWSNRGTFSIGYVNNMFFERETAGWFVVSGALVSVKDLGNELDLKFTRDEPQARINDVFFLNKDVGWICGDDGSILKTEDGGVSWKPERSGTPIDLKEIRFLNAQEGWSSGSKYNKGTVTSITLITRNGGDSWGSLDESNGMDLSPVSFTSLRHGCGINDDSAILCTNNGQDWQVVYSDEGTRKIKRAIFFVNETQGWVVGDCIWHTGDGGRTWKQQFTIPRDSSLTFDQVVFLNERLGWARTLEGVWRTSDGGNTWTRISDAWIRSLAKTSVSAPRLSVRKQ